MLTSPQNSGAKKTVPKGAVVIAHNKAKKGGSMPVKVHVEKIVMSAPRSIQRYGMPKGD